MEMVTPEKKPSMDVDTDSESACKSTSATLDKDRKQADPKTLMFSRIANSDAFFKQQQRDDPDLTFEDKQVICSELFDKKPGIFLERYGKYLTHSDIVLFEKNDDYTVQFYLKEIMKRIGDAGRHTVAKNRRYRAMKQLADAGEYFSDREMKYRDPLLYEQMVGKHLTEEEVNAQVAAGDGELSTFLFDQIESIHNNELYAKQVQMEMNLQDGSSGSESDSESEMEDEDELGMKRAAPISDSERVMLRHEFTTIMQQRFIQGDDKDFNYVEVDENAEYDCIDIRERDEQEKYFDDEDSQTACSMASSIDDDISECSTFKQLHIKDQLQSEKDNERTTKSAHSDDTRDCNDGNVVDET